MTEPGSVDQAASIRRYQSGGVNQAGHDLLGQLRRHHGADPVDVTVRVQLYKVGADKASRKFLNDRQNIACRQTARLVVRDPR